MLSGKQKKAYLVLVIIAVGWWLLTPVWVGFLDTVLAWLEDTDFGQGMWIFFLFNLSDERSGKLFGFLVLAIGSGCIAVRAEDSQKRFLYALTIALTALWAAVPFFRHLTIRDMSYFNPNMAEINLVPFHWKFSSLLVNILFRFPSNGDSWLNIGLFIPLGVLTAGRKKRWAAVLICIGTGCLIELLQFCTSIGHLDVNDMVYRAVGTLIGLGIGIFSLRRTRR